MKIKLGATLGTTALLLTGLGAMAPAASAAELGAAAASCTTTKVIAKTATTYIRLPSTSTSITCEMSRGASGVEVRALQNALNHCYSAGLDSDGIFGPATESALKRAQTKGGTAADGIYGPNTRDAINWPRFNETSHFFTGYCAKR